MESSWTHFEVLGLEGQVLGLSLEALGPRKLPCPRLEDSTIFWTVEILLKNARNLAENLRRPFFAFLNRRSPEKNFWRPFIWRTLALVFLVLGLEHSCPRPSERVCPWKSCPWPRIFLYPWPRALCSRLHLCSLASDRAQRSCSRKKACLKPYFRFDFVWCSDKARPRFKSVRSIA